MITIDQMNASAALPIGGDAPVRFELRKFGCIDLRQFASDDSTARSLRTRIRYLAALFPDTHLRKLAEAIHAVIANEELSVHDVRCILEGRRLNDPSKLTGEVPLDAIQTIGRVLAGGASKLKAAAEAGVSIDTVTAIDDYLGLTQRFEERMLDMAIAALHDGKSVRDFAKASGLPRSSAHRKMQHARKVLREIGDMS